MAAAPAPTLQDWQKRAGDTTYGILLQRMTPADRKAAYDRFVKDYAKTGDADESTAYAVQSVQNDAEKASTARKAAQARPAPPTSGTAPAAAPQGQVAPAKPAADAASQAAQNPQASALTQGPFSAAQGQATSLFGTGGIDPTTPIPGRVPGPPVASNGEQLSGRGSFGVGGDGEQLSGRGSFGGQDPNAGSYAPEATQTADQWLSGLYKMSPAELAKLQTQMYGAGWYDPNDVPTANAIPFGKVDPATISAYEKAMIETARYNAAGKHLLLDDVIAQGAPRVPGAGKGVKKPSQSFVNPVDLKNQLQQSADTLTGQDMSAAQAEKFAQYYQSQEQASYAQYAQAGVDRAAGLGGSYTGPASPQASAEAFIRQTDPTAVQAYGMASRSQEFLNLLGSATGR